LFKFILTSFKSIILKNVRQYPIDQFIDQTCIVAYKNLCTTTALNVICYC